MKFTEFGFHPQLLEGIDASGYETATPVQEQVIPSILAGHDIIASAQTGTGKTAAFLLPVMNKLIEHSHDNQVSALIIVPTRELAIQIAQHMEGLSYFTNISSIAIFGGTDGQSFVTEKKALQLGADIIVCTPGRLIAHMNMGYVSLKGLQFLVLDEADRMLDMGFSEDLSKIIQQTPQQRQTLLFSATMPEKIRQLARKILRNPVEVNIAISKPPEKIVQRAFVVYENQKLGMIQHLLKTTPHKVALIFCSSKQSVKQLTRELKHAKLNAAEIHSDLEQSEREEVLLGFGSGRIPVLVATDILSRGIDIDTIDLVINYDVPHDGEDYVHRIGRTARAQADGVAFTLISERDQYKFGAIEQLLGTLIEKGELPAEAGKGPAYEPGRRKSGGHGNRGKQSRPHGNHHKKPAGQGGNNRRPEHNNNSNGPKSPAKHQKRNFNREIKGGE